MLVRERIIQQRKAILSPYACADDAMNQREQTLEPCPVRTDFQRDRDRIIHCKAFRRMKHKTQCFLAPEGDHFRTRLTHTLEVSQIARTIARALALNEDLTEAIALGHDLGHTPFGHMGERILSHFSPRGFAHEEQSLRVVTHLEGEGAGLNLTHAVRDGIVQHTSRGNPCTLEGTVVSLSDRIAYLNHDIDDAIRAGVLQKEELPQDILAVLGHTHGQRIDTMIQDIVHTSDEQTFVRMSVQVGDAVNTLRGFMFEHVYTRQVVQAEEEKAEFMLRSLFEYYMQHMKALPRDVTYEDTQEGHVRAVCDYIAGMTDRYAVNRFSMLFIPGNEVMRG